MNRLDLTGQTFGRLKVVSEATFVDKPGRWWLCDCACGGSRTASTSQLRDKHRSNHSCGCAVKESIAAAAKAALAVTTKFRHPLKQKLKWMIGNMIKRCHRPGSNRYERYGGRGIKVCDQWRYNQTAFFEWAVANGFSEGMSIERIDVDGNYCPENCRFIPLERQQNNTSRSRILEFCGERLTVSDWARRLGVNPRVLQHRLDRGWSIDRLMTQGFRKRETA